LRSCPRRRAESNVRCRLPTTRRGRGHRPGASRSVIQRHARAAPLVGGAVRETFRPCPSARARTGGPGPARKTPAWNGRRRSRRGLTSGPRAWPQGRFPPLREVGKPRMSWPRRDPTVPETVLPGLRPLIGEQAGTAHTRSSQSELYPDRSGARGRKAAQPPKPRSARVAPRPAAARKGPPRHRRPTAARRAGKEQ